MATKDTDLLRPTRRGHRPKKIINGEMLTERFAILLTETQKKKLESLPNPSHAIRAWIDSLE